MAPSILTIPVLPSSPCVVIISTSILLFSCNPYTTNNDGNMDAIKAALQGTWLGFTWAPQGGLCPPNTPCSPTYSFSFLRDSFTIDVKSTTNSVPQQEDSCNSHLWHDYASGSYTVTSDSLFLLGTYTDSAFVNPIGIPCHPQRKAGTYRAIYDYHFTTDTLFLGQFIRLTKTGIST